MNQPTAACMHRILRSEWHRRRVSAVRGRTALEIKPTQQKMRTNLQNVNIPNRYETACVPVILEAPNQRTYNAAFIRRVFGSC